MNTALARAQARLRTAQQILAELELMERWGAFGKPVLVGAVAYGLVVAPDIDMEVYCDQPRIEDGFEVLKACAAHSRVRRARFANELAGPDQGLYWQLRYLHDDDVEWKIDMWSVRRDHPGPTGARLVEPMNNALTDGTRQTILALKEQALLDPALSCPSIHLYRAVLDDGVRTLDELKDWTRRNRTEGLSDWLPKAKQL